MCKMAVEITKETWGKCGIKTVKKYNEKENIIELEQKMSNIEIQLGHSSTDDVALKRIKKYYSKKNKRHHRRRTRKIESFFEGEAGIFIIEKLTRDITERCKLPEAIELRK